MKKLLKLPLAGIFFSFGAMQAMQLLLPLLAFPWLGRILGPEFFGLLMYMSLYSQAIVLTMEWGLTLGGARQAALMRENPAGLAQLLSAVFSAKIILACACAAVCLCIMPFVPHALAWPAAFMFTVFEGICRGISPVWFFQGMGQGIRRMAVWDVLSSVCALVLIFFCIRSPDEWPHYFLFCAASKGLAYFWLSAGLWRKYRLKFAFREGFKILKATCVLFGGSFFTATYTYGTQMVMGFFLVPAQMGIIVACGKMLRALGKMVEPFTQTVFPEICILRLKNQARARRLLKISLLVAFALMCACAAIIWLFAPWVMHIALGREYIWGAPALRYMVLAAPLFAINQTLGAQSLVPFGFEKLQTLTLAIAAFISIPLGIFLAVRWGMIGAAWTPVFVELIIVTGYVMAIRAACPQAFFDQKIN